MSGWLLTIYGFLTLAVAIGYCWSGETWLGMQALAPAATGGFKAAFFVGGRGMKVAVSIIAALVLGLAYWLALGFEAGLFGMDMSGVAWIVVGAVLGYAGAERGEPYYFVDPTPKSASN
jgi:hypothetical protein